MNISLLVEHLPIVSTNHSTISVSPGHSTHLTCQVTAVPVPAVSWYSLKNNQEPAMIKSRGDLSISIKDYKDGRMTSSLILHNVTQDHYGGYSCNATNTEGEVWPIFVTAQLTSILQASAIISLVQPSNTSGGEGLWRNRNNLLVVFTVFIGWIKFH